ncbi:Outer membrane receptor proteins mostly Fe transport-like protein [Catenovulum agarivorans DS-2]|uniref:Outer membrane receptor proteins mostly Fe transport-like protein n=1 Tax=Catenovulum agarivorans DS-2 TaxID=1328313 RepID=W7Q8Q8_9ALTE|nr:TonB-dependent receptor plug domain-containing protein [Catenovulum agarivorans]EWH08391.1 Outer membrane receptor proteins mostly Fe transport-like protein [Catenovulum agarivorans DS-2]
MFNFKFNPIQQVLFVSGVLFNSFVIAADNAETETTETASEKAQPTEEIQVVGSRRAYYTQITENAEKLTSMPGSMGDPIAAISALPGVIIPASGGEPAVRGSSPADNRYYIDGMPAGYIFHEFNTSIFDAQTIQDFQLYSAGFGAEYQGATGAVFDVRLRDPKKQDIAVTLDASLLRAGVFIEGQATENSAFYLSARKGLIQYFMPEQDEADEDGIRVIDPPQDSDYLAKYVWDINPQHQLTLMAVGASDYVEAELTDNFEMVALNPDFAGDAKIDNGFASQAVTWLYTPKSGHEMQWIIARYKDDMTTEWGEDYYETIDFVEQYIKGKYSFNLTNAHTVTLGGEYKNTEFAYDLNTVHFVCTEFEVNCQASRRDPIHVTHKLTTKDSTVFISDLWQINQDVSLETGLQATRNSYLDETFVHPRMALTWHLSPNLTLLSSAGRYNRFADIGTAMPEIGNPNIKQPVSNHYTFGFKGEFLENWSWQVDSYYKTFDRLPTALPQDQDPDDQYYVAQTSGDAKGVEFLLNRDRADNWYGWMSLSYSRSERTNNLTGQTSDYRLDTPVVFNMVGNYQFHSGWQLGFRFIAKSGEAYTQVVDIQPNPYFEDKYIGVYGEPYAKRLPTYARLDFRASKPFSMFGKEAEFYVDVINALNRQNVVERDLDYVRVNKTGELAIEEEQDMGIFPSVGLKVTF